MPSAVGHHGLRPGHHRRFSRAKWLFGSISSTGNNAPRQMQFAAKLIF